MHLLKRIFFPLTIATFLSLAYFINWTHTNMFLKKIEPEVEYKLMEKRVVDISVNHTAIDSVKYKAAVAGLCFDTRVLTAQYFRRILLDGPNLSFEHIKSRFYHIVSFYRYYIFIPCYIFSLLLTGIFIPLYRQAIVKIGLFNIIVFIIIYVIDYTGGIISGRHFLSFELIALLITTFYFFNIEKEAHFDSQNISPVNSFNVLFIIFTCIMFVIFGSCISLINIKKSSTTIAEATQCYEKTMCALDSYYHGRIIILTTDNFHIFDHPFSIRTKKYTRNTYLMFDVWTYYLASDYLAYLNTECGCDPLDPLAFFKWLSDKNALYIAEPYRYELTSEYMSIVHGKEVKFIPEPGYSKPDCLENTNMKDFDIRKISVLP